MQQIQVTASFQVPPDKAAAFRHVASQLIEAVKAREPGTLQYLWYFSEDGLRCSVREIYTDSAAVLHHLANCSELLPALFEQAAPEVDVTLYGPASNELRAALADLGPPVFNYHDGVDRVLGA